MIGNIPPRPVGSDRAAIFMQWVHDCLTTILRQTPVSGQVCSRTTKGFFTVGGGRPKVSVVEQGLAKQAKITALSTPLKGDYFVAQEWDGTNFVGSAFNVAKQSHYRPSITSLTVDATALTLAYTTDNLRVVTDALENEQTDVVYPRFRVGEIVYVMACESLGVVAPDPVTEDPVPVEWIDITNRYWLRRNIT